jgi:hypothetical protein
MPVVGVNVRERPNNILQVQPRLNLRVLTDVRRIVEINEIVPERLAKDRPRDRDQRGADRESQSKLGAHGCVELSWSVPERKQDVDLKHGQS